MFKLYGRNILNRDGIVIEEKGNDRAIVELLKHTACGDCGACHLGDDNKHIRIICQNDVGAKEGERVVVDLDFPEVLSAAFIMYTLPLLALLIGVFAGYYGYTNFISSSGSEVFAMFVGFILMGASYLFIKSRESKFSADKKYLTHIVDVQRTQILTAAQSSNISQANFGHKKLGL